MSDETAIKAACIQAAATLIQHFPSRFRGAANDDVIAKEVVTLAIALDKAWRERGSS